jgi:hypothetical protein
LIYKSIRECLVADGYRVQAIIWSPEPCAHCGHPETEVSLWLREAPLLRNVEYWRRCPGCEQADRIETREAIRA